VDGESWWMWGLRILGALSFGAVVVYYFTGKKKMPRYILAISLIAFVCGAVVGYFDDGAILLVISRGLLWSAVPPLIWFSCGGPVVAKSKTGRRAGE